MSVDRLGLRLRPHSRHRTSLAPASCGGVVQLSWWIRPLWWIGAVTVGRGGYLDREGVCPCDPGENPQMLRIARVWAAGLQVLAEVSFDGPVEGVAPLSEARSLRVDSNPAMSSFMLRAAGVAAVPSLAHRSAGRPRGRPGRAGDALHVTPFPVTGGSAAGQAAGADPHTLVEEWPRLLSPLDVRRRTPRGSRHQRSSLAGSDQASRQRRPMRQVRKHRRSGNGRSSPCVARRS